ncbi:baseplate J/gp47 family protein [Fusibacter sp. 3D3]|uniref:baseplate J/gp47 family protein n=1 Tax=Fusibacter sp. 3D3 TaxID=1048380 RepID=UPI0008535E3F|nr:baseplate J/gp47 family protein [Fusibacter sp. 3D3]GAU79503.1 phage-like element PBSX protein xkdT [Fusibacter sp. 3D3]
MFENETQEAIQKRMDAMAVSEINTGEGSMFHVATAPIAVELMQAYFNLERVLELGFAETTSGPYLDMRAREHGIQRKLATKAKGKIRIEGSPGTIVSKGSLFATQDGRTYITDMVATIIDTFVDVSVTASDYGTLYNTGPYTVVALPMSISGVTSVTNPAAIGEGTNEESDTALLERLLSHVRKPATSGNVYQYQQWAESLAGVGGVKVMPLWNGPGAVKIVIVDETMSPASASLVSSVSEYIETQRPIGAQVTYISASGIAIDIEAQIVLSKGYTLDEVLNLFNTNVVQYLMRDVAFKVDSKNAPIQVSIAKIGSILIETEGVSDYVDLKVNGATHAITLNIDEVPVKGSVNLYE